MISTLALETFRSYGPTHISMNFRATIIALMIASTWFALSYPLRDALATPKLEEVLKDLSFSDSEQQRILNGDFVQWTARSGSDRELAVGMVLLFQEAPEDLVPLFREGVEFKVIEAVTAHGQITGKGTVADFAQLKLEPNGEDEATRYLDAKPGDSLNLDAEEIAAFHKLKATPQNRTESRKAVEALLRQRLLARYQAYRSKGPEGISPYDRGNGEQLHVGQELLLATEADQVLAKHAPLFHTILLKYPAVDASGFEEWFHWLNIEVFGRPTLILSHRMLLRDGDAYLAAERHFYASREYNGLQSVGGLLPTDDGTILIYLNRVSTEQVAGFGSSVKHPVARGLMGPYVVDMFEKIRARAERK